MTVTSTGWKNPLSLSQDYSSKINNGHACYKFYDLDDIKSNDNHNAYIPGSGGIDSLRASPVIYAYNYNFQIPVNAVIKSVYVCPILKQWSTQYGKLTKVKTLKLKTGSSLTDYGTGNNLATEHPDSAMKTYISNYRIPYTWTSEESWTSNGKYVFSGDKSVWNVELTPSLVNASTFGCVFQVVGTEYKKWVGPAVARLMMKIDYEIPEAASSVVYEKNTTDVKFRINDAVIEFDSNNTSKTTYNGLNVDNQDEGINIEVDYIHIGKSGQTPSVAFSASNLLISSKKTKTYTMSTLSMNDDSKSKTYIDNVSVYPSQMQGTQTLTVEYNKKKYYIKFNLISTIYTQMSAVEKEKYQKDGQFCKIINCVFKNNVAESTNKDGTKQGNGGAMLIATEHFQYRPRNWYGEGDEANRAGASDGVPNLWYNGKKLE